MFGSRKYPYKLFLEGFKGVCVWGGGGGGRGSKTKEIPEGRGVGQSI